MAGKFAIVFLAIAAMACAALGVYSLWYEVRWRGSVTDQHWASVAVESGNLQLAFARTSEEERERRGRSVHLGVLGVFSIGSGRSREWNYGRVALPMWPIVLALVACPAWRIVRMSILARVRRAKDCCAECGYNLTGNETGVCPECGKNVALQRAWLQKVVLRQAAARESPTQPGAGIVSGGQGDPGRNEESQRTNFSA